ncbi:hypothetical protein PFISCL1PPCAC_512, partial [Pristionchus fissidentatus]
TGTTGTTATTQTDPGKLKPAVAPRNITRPYINVDEVLRIGAVLERRSPPLTEAQRLAFDAMAFTRTFDKPPAPEFHTHLQRAIGGVVLSPRLALESLHALVQQGLLSGAEKDAVVDKLKITPLKDISMLLIGELLRSEAAMLKRAPGQIE